MIPFALYFRNLTLFVTVHRIEDLGTNLQQPTATVVAY